MRVKKILGIYGTGGSGRELLEMIYRFESLSSRWAEVVFIDDTKPAGMFRDCRMMPLADFKNQFGACEAEVVIAVGEPYYRLLMAKKVRDAGYSLATIVHPMAHISPTAKIGDGVVVRVGSILSADCVVENNVWIQTYATIGHDVVIGENSQISGNAFVAGQTKIGKNVYVGVAASIKEEVEVGDDSIVSMGAVVLGSFGPKSVVMGSPARKIADNDSRLVFKSDKHEASRKVANAGVAKTSDWENEIIDIIAAALNIPSSEITKDTGAGDVREWNSIAQMSIVAGIESAFGIHFSQEQLFKLTKVSSIVDAVESCRVNSIGSHSPIVSRVREVAGESPDKVALICGEERVSYKRLFSRILATAAFLQSKGLAKGDCLALSAEKGLSFVYAYLGAHVLDVTVVVVDPESNPKKMAYMMELTKPKVAIGFVQDGLLSFMYTDIDRDSGALPTLVDGASIDDVADIVFTTGTTGNPKGVLLSHFNIFSSADNINGFIGNGPDEVEVLGLPLCHSFGLGRLRCTLLKGATLVVIPSFANIQVFFDALERYNATGFGMVPAVWAYIRKFSGTRIAKYASQIKYIEIGSAAMPLASKEELCDLFPTTRICHHYGLTEASRNCFMEYHASRNDLSTIGKEVSEKVEIKIFDDDGIECPAGTAGEICVKGNMVMKGYFLKDESEKAFINGYFRTGDEGYRSEAGNIYLVSRKKEIINVGGKKVSPIEVEDCVLAMGGVEDCGCIGVPDPDGVLGEVPKLFVQQTGCTRTFEEIATHLKKHLEPYKAPVAYEWIDSIPKTSSGKKQRLQLKR